MIGDQPALTIKRKFNRATKEQLEALSKAQTSFIADALGGRAGLAHNVKPVTKSHQKFCGPAVTCHTGPSDNLAVFGALHIAQAGDIIMIAADGFQGTATIGDMVLGMGKNAGVSAMVTDGCVRDLTGIEAVGIPCFATGIHPDSPAKVGPGTVGLPIHIGGVRVEAGDVVIGDLDGVVVIPFARIDEVITALDEIYAKERAMEQKVNEGITMSPALEGYFESDAVVFVD